MKCVEKVVNEIYTNSKIPFQLCIDDDNIYTTPFFATDEKQIEKKFELKYTKCCIKISAAFSATIDLLVFCLSSKLEEVFIRKQNIISSLLSGKEVGREVITTVWPTLNKEFYFINIYVENNLEEVLDAIKECYLDSNVELLIYNDYLLMLGDLEEPLEHLESIKDTIQDNFIGKCYISYCSVEGVQDLLKAYKNTSYKISLAKKYNLANEIFDSKKLIFEGIIDSVQEEIKLEVINSFNDGIAQLDGEMIRTIDVFFKCGLNLSEAAKKLYIHRNTLIYRLDKIQKCTTYDIRDFNSAVLFKIIFFLWKEKNN